MKKLILVILLLIVNQLISQTISSSDFIIESGSTEQKAVQVDIPYSIVNSSLSGLGVLDSIFDYVEVKVKVSGGGEKIYYIDGIFEGEEKIYYHNDILYAGSYSEAPYLYHVAPVDGGIGEYPYKVTAKIDYIIVHYIVDSLNQSTLLAGNSPYDETTYIYWNKITNHNISLSSMQAGSTTKATSSFDPTNSEVPIDSKWTVEISKSGEDTIIYNYNSGNNNFIDNIVIPSDYDGGKIKITNKVEFVSNPNQFKEFSNEYDITSWTDNLNISLTPNDTCLCSNNQTTFNVSILDSLIPQDVTPTWTSSNLQILSSTRTSVTVKANTSYNGLGSVNLIYSSSNKVIIGEIWLGTPIFTLTPIDYIMQTMEPGFTSIDYYGSTNYIIQGVNRVDWSYTGPIMMINGDFTKAHFTTDRREGIGFIYANVYNSCGSTENRTFFEVEDGFIMYGPNPADEEVVISLESDTESLQSYSTSKETEDSNEEIATLILYDQNSNVIFNDKLSGKKKEVKWNTSNLKNGTYLLHINKKNETIKKQIIIEHK